MELRPSEEQRAVALPEGSDPGYPTPEWAKTPPGDPAPERTETAPEDPVRERIEMAAEDLNRSIQEYGRATPEGRIESDEARKRRLRKERLARRISRWLAGCWPDEGDDERKGCRQCEYRSRRADEEAGIVGCEGVEGAMVPVRMLEDLRALVKMVREDVAK